jgi:hypothetical protein
MGNNNEKSPTGLWPRRSKGVRTTIRLRYVGALGSVQQLVLG